MKKTLDFAPELVFQKSIEGADYYQFRFNWLQKTINPMFPVVVGHKRGYILTVAEKDGKFYSNIQDEAGLDFSSNELEREKFVESWKQFITLMKKHAI